MHSAAYGLHVLQAVTCTQFPGLLHGLLMLCVGCAMHAIPVGCGHYGWVIALYAPHDAGCVMHTTPGHLAA